MMVVSPGQWIEHLVSSTAPMVFPGERASGTINV
jgi:hypothetical protein